MMTQTRTVESVNTKPISSELSYEEVYSFTAEELSQEYRNSLFESLQRGTPAMAEIEFEDERRFSSYNDESFESVHSRTPAVSRSNSAQRVRKERVFDRNKTHILVLYCVMVLAIVIALVLTVPGTAWEGQGVRVSVQGTSGISMGTTNAYANETGVNTISTENGSEVVDVSPYVEPENPDTNWFDKACDWVNSIFGG